MKHLDKITLALGLLAGGIVLGMYLERTRLYDKFKAMAEKAKQPATAAAPATVAAPAATAEATAFAEGGGGPAGIA